MLFVLLWMPLSVSAQSRADISAVGGGGVVGGEDQKTTGLGFGASIGFPYSARHRLQIDYFFTNIKGELRAPEIGLNIPDANTRNQLFTASYIRQARTGGSRPFFQVGAGIVHRRFHSAAG